MFYFEVESMCVGIIRNRITGTLRPALPGTDVRWPWEEILQVLNCRRRVKEISISAVTKDAQTITFSCRLIIWIDALDEKGEPKESGRRAETAARNLPELPEKEFQEHCDGLAFEIVSMNLKKWISKLNMNEIEKNEILKTWKEGKEIVCPKCGGELKLDSNEKSVVCQNENCGKKVVVDRGLLPFLSAMVSIESDHLLSEKFGIGTQFEILYQKPPEEIAKARLEAQIAERQKEVAKKKKKVARVEAEILKYYQEKGGIPPWVITTVNAIKEIVGEFIEIKKEEVRKDERRGEEKK